MTETPLRSGRETPRLPARPASPRLRLLIALCISVAVGSLVPVQGADMVLPFVKDWRPAPGALTLRSAKIDISARLENEGAILRAGLLERGVAVADGGVPVRLETAAFDGPAVTSRYARQIHGQGYRIRITSDQVHLQAPTAAGAYYAVQTLLQLLTADATLPRGEIIDWPDLPERGVMVDPARANENADYYERLIRFCGRYKLNRIHVHLTDDQNVCLHHEDYAPLLHPHAWTPARLAPLVALARRHHIELIPEIESLGHARVFLRHPDFRDILHQTTDQRPAGWSGTDVPGYTNVLCPASPQADAYLERMYARTADAFPYPELHVGCDEVDMTHCARCAERHPGLSPAEWFARHVRRCRQLLAAHDRRIALWGDMILKHRDIAARIPTDAVIYDWHYRPDVSDESVVFFKRAGFEVVACPALVCWPRMVMPWRGNYENIARFAEIARRHDLRGINTTIWIPTRYLSDALWPGIAWAAVHSWAGRNRDEPAFHRRFASDHFGLAEPDGFVQAWHAIADVDWPLELFKASCWSDEAGLARARELAAGDHAARARGYLADLGQARRTLQQARPAVRRHALDFDAIERSAAILEYVLRHFLASRELAPAGPLDRALLHELDADCVAAIGWIEADWDRNRFADDPYKADLNHTGQHLLDRFRRMHAWHTELLERTAQRD